METLIELLQSNTSALDTLEERYKTILSSKYYEAFNKENERINDLTWVTKIRKRVLRMRYRILENLQKETFKEMQYASSEMRALLTKKVA